MDLERLADLFDRELQQEASYAGEDSVAQALNKAGEAFKRAVGYFQRQPPTAGFAGSAWGRPYTQGTKTLIDLYVENEVVQTVTLNDTAIGKANLTRHDVVPMKRADVIAAREVANTLIRDMKPYPILTGLATRILDLLPRID